MKATWADVGKPSSPTSIMFRGYELTIGQAAIDIWRLHPNARFEVLTVDEMDGRYASLGAWSVREDWK